MVKTTAKIMSDQSGRPTIIDVKGYKVKLNYNSDGVIYSVDFYGKTPSIPDILGSLLGLTSHIASPVKVKTEAGDNLIVDKLTQGAYIAYHSTLKNHGVVPKWLNITGDWRHGKLFPSGCRGFIDTIDIYCRDVGAAGGTITVYISPYSDMGYIASATVTVPAGGAAAWREANFDRTWNYDSLFIFVVCSTADIEISYDSEEADKIDQQMSSDAGVTWVGGLNRFWFRVIMFGQPLATIPISGTVNNISMPNQSTRQLGAGTSVPNLTETSILTIEGSGELKDARIYYLNATAPTAGGVVYRLHIYIDGVWVYRTSNIWLTQSHTATSGRNGIGEFVQGDGESWLVVRVNLPFKRKIELRAQHSVGVAVTAVGELTVAAVI